MSSHDGTNMTSVATGSGNSTMVMLTTTPTSRLVTPARAVGSMVTLSWLEQCLALGIFVALM